MATPRLRFSRLVAGLSALAALGLLVAPVPQGVAPDVMRAAAVVTFSLGLWSSGVLPEYLTSVIFLFLAVVLAAAPPGVVMSGFSSSPVWLVFGGLIIGVAMAETGLGRRLAQGLVGRFGGTYFGIVCGIVVVSALFAFVMPSSMGRVLIILPIVLALADRLGFGKGTNGRVGMALAVPAGTFLPTFGILPANVPNIAMAGAAERIYGIEFTYGSYLLQNLPVAGPITVAALPFLIVWLFPAVAGKTGRLEASPPLSAREVRLIVILAGALGLWITDTIHGISPAWVSMGAGLLCVLPRVGVMAPETLVEKMNYGPWFFLAGMIGLGAVVAHSGLGAVLSKAILPYLGLAPGEHARNFASLVGLGMGMSVVTTIPGQPAIMTALAGELAAATGWPVYHVLMAQVPTWSLILFPYQVPPLFIAMQIAGIRIGQGIRLLLPFAVFNWLVLVPLQYLWWRFLGYPL